MLFGGTFVFVTFACCMFCYVINLGWQKASEEESVILTLKAEGS